MTEALPKFITPRRPQCTIKLKKAQAPDVHAWTAARCHRLLRPLNSRIELLRKDTLPLNNDGIPVDDQHQSMVPLTSPNSRTNNVAKVSGDNNACWDRGTKRVRKTYTSRSKLKEDLVKGTTGGSLTTIRRTNQGRKEILQPGEILVPTPILDRSKPLTIVSNRNQTPDTAIPNKFRSKTSGRFQSCPTNRGGECYFELAEAMRQIGRTTTATRYKTYEGIYNGLEAILKATVDGEGQSRLPTATKICNAQIGLPSGLKSQNSRSLLSTCLRRVPHYIDIEEKCAAIEAEDRGLKPAFDTRILSTEIYSDLEFLGTSGRGWRHLKAIVRAHAIHLVAKSIGDGLVDATFASTLTLLCVYTSFSGEAEVLLTSLLTKSRYPNPKSNKTRFSEDYRLLPLVTLENFVRHTGRVGYYQRQVEELIVSGSLPVEWLGTRQLEYLWTTVFRCLSTDSGDRDATSFISSILPLICTRNVSRVPERDERSACQMDMPTVLENTLASVLTTLSAISLLSPRHAQNISNLFRGSILDCQILLPNLDVNRAAFIAMATLLVGLESGGDAKSLIEFLQCLGDLNYPPSRSRILKDSICTFIVSTARCCGRGSSGDAFDHLRTILDRLQAVSASKLFSGAPTMKEVVIETAFVFAQHVADPKHLRYAQNLGAHLEGSGLHPAALPRTCRAKSDMRFRWEEGINEWVVATPAETSRQSPKAKFIFSDVESDCETPVRPSKKQQKQGEAQHMWFNISVSPHSSFGKVSDLTPLSPNENQLFLQNGDQRSKKPFQHHFVSSQTSCIIALGVSSRPIVNTLEPGCTGLVSRSRHDQGAWEPSDDELDPRNGDYAKDRMKSFRPALKTVRSGQMGMSAGMERTRTDRDVRFLEESEDELGL